MVHKAQSNLLVFIYYLLMLISDTLNIANIIHTFHAVYSIFLLLSFPLVVNEPVVTSFRTYFQNCVFSFLKSRASKQSRSLFSRRTFWGEVCSQARNSVLLEYAGKGNLHNEGPLKMKTVHTLLSCISYCQLSTMPWFLCLYFLADFKFIKIIFYAYTFQLVHIKLMFCAAPVLAWKKTRKK